MGEDAKNRFQGIYAHSIAAVPGSDISLLELPNPEDSPTADRAGTGGGYRRLYVQGPGKTDS
jgi:hypothetical protein